MTGFKRPLEDEDIWELRKEYTAEEIGKQIDEEWNKEMRKMYK